MADSTIRIVNDNEWAGYFVEKFDGGRWNAVGWRFTLWGARRLARRIGVRGRFVEYC